MCMNCKAREETCQTNLQLMNLWNTLESRVESKFGRLEAKISEFLKQVDESKECWNVVDRNN
jgi:hypothetical protein